MNAVGQHQRQFYRFIQLLLLMLTTTQTAYGSGIVTAPSTPFGPTEYTSFSFNAPCSRYTDPVTGSVSEQPFASISLLLSCLNRYPAYPVCATNPCYLLIPMSPLTYTSYPSKWYRTWCGYQYCAFGQAKPSCPAGYILPNLPAPQQANVCVANSMANASCNLGLTCICNPGFAPDASARSCVLQCQPGQQPNAAGTACVTPPPSTCPAGQVPHKWGGCMLACPAGQHPNIQDTQCVPDDSCTDVLPLTPLPIDDACAQVQENLKSTQAQKDAACGTLTPEMQAAVDRFSAKLSGLSPATPLLINSQRRNYAYQAHFREMWVKMEQLVQKAKDDPTLALACASRRAEVAAEKGCDHAGNCKKNKNDVCYAASAAHRSHCITGEPSPATSKGDSHTNGTAIDTKLDSTIRPLQKLLNAGNPPMNIQQFLDVPPATGLRWGGFFNKPDDVHFQVPR